MKCPHCAKEVPDSAKVCGYCGTRLEKKIEPVKKMIREVVKESSAKAPAGKPKWLVPVIAAAMLVVLAVISYLVLKPSFTPAAPAVQAPMVSNPPPVSSIPPTAKPTDINLGGVWSGEGLTFRLASSCQLNVVCGTFELPAIPLKGDVTFVRINGNRYEFKATNLSGGGTSDAILEYLEPLSSTTMQYYGKTASWEHQFVLNKVG